MRESFYFLSMVAWMEPEAEASNRYRVAVGYHGEPEGFMTVPNRKKAERIILDCLREEALTFADDDPDEDDREELLSFVTTMRGLDELDLIKTSQAYACSVDPGPRRANCLPRVHR